MRNGLLEIIKIVKTFRDDMHGFWNVLLDMGCVTAYDSEKKKTGFSTCRGTVAWMEAVFSTVWSQVQRFYSGSSSRTNIQRLQSTDSAFEGRAETELYISGIG